MIKISYLPKLIMNGDGINATSELIKADVV